MTQQTAELVSALGAVNKQMPRITTDLLTGTMTPERERALAELFTELADVLASHADDRQTPRGPITLADRVGITGRQLVGIATRLRTKTIAGSELHDASAMLTALADAVRLFAGELPVPPVAANPLDPPVL